jgi:predicted dehydrogenase
MLPFPHLDKRVRVAVIGLGSMGQRYAKFFSSISDAVIYGVDPREETFEVHTGWQYLSVEELVEKVLPTIAVIAVPASEHLKVLRTLRDAAPDCAVLMEKPVSDHALSEAEIRWCQDLDGLIAIGYNWRVHPYAKHLWTVRESIRNLTCYVAQDMRDWPGKHYCDPLREFSHELDLVQYLTSDPVLTQSAFEADGTGRRIRYVLNGTHEQGNWRVYILPFHQPSGRWVRVQMTDGAVVFKHWDQAPYLIEGMYQYQARQLLDAYLHGGSSDDLSCSLGDALQTTRLLDEAERRCQQKP